MVLNYIHTTTDEVSDVVETIREEFLNPLMQTMTIMHGVKEGINMISGFFGKNKGGRNGK